MEIPLSRSLFRQAIRLKCVFEHFLGRFSDYFRLALSLNGSINRLTLHTQPPTFTHQQIMPTVRLSGSILADETDEKREERALLLYHLFSNRWTIQNSNGDECITLSNIEEKIIEADAFAFTPAPDLEDLFKLTSIFVGYQTLDPNLKHKPTIILNDDQSWDNFFELLYHLHRMGTVSQDVDSFLRQVDTPESLIKELSTSLGNEMPDAGREVIAKEETNSTECDPPSRLKYNVCVFCSATIKDEAYLKDGYAFGKRLAQSNIGCVSGAGKSGIMGQVVAGANDHGGWTGGSNVPHIIALEGLPDGLDCFWPRPDIYTRMEVMIKNSDAFVAFPGGSGTVQEVLALLILRIQEDPLMKDKPIVLYNRVDEDGISFWEPLVGLLKDQGVDNLVTSVSDMKDILPAIEKDIG